ncbi:cytochrome P450 [Thozetella sp. PMI_491]|nr:cytochrome P450 [Thozetella sp. PMI_491]
MSLVEPLLSDGLIAKATRSVFLAAAIALTITWTSWLFTSWKSWRDLAAAERAKPGEKRPPTLPSAVPLIGHVFQFMQDGHGFMSNAARYFGRGVPVRVSLLTFPSYMISGSESVSAFLKDQRKQLSRIPRGLNYMEYAFGCPREFLHEFKPRKEVEIEQQIHTAMQTLLAGPGLEVLADRYQEEVARQALSSKQVSDGDGWTEIPDLCAFVEKHVLEGATRALYGPHLLELNPSLADDFWDFNSRVKSMFMGVPKWMNPSAVRARDKMTANVRRWQRFAAKECDINEIPDDVEWEPYYGSKFTRVRQQLLTKRNIMDERARAAENLAFIWATNANSVPAACWFLLETLHDPSLSKRVQIILDEARIKSMAGSNTTFEFDITKLTSDTLLQSIFAEILRLRVAALVVREPTTADFSLPGGWHIKPHETVSMSTRTELMDPGIWNAGDVNDPHPLDQFWAERFIVYPDDPSSGPLKEPKHRVKSRINGSTPTKSEPFFSLDGCTWSWVPFGGGRQLCPGRHFAKREILLTAAIFLTAFEIELLTDTLPMPNKGFYGFGTLPPDGKVPCRIRRRHH